MKKNEFFCRIVSNADERERCLPGLEMIAYKLKELGLKRRDVVQSLAYSYRVMHLKGYAPELAVNFLLGHLYQQYEV